MKRTVCTTIAMLTLSALLSACGGSGGGGGGGGGGTNPSACQTSTSFEFNATGPFCIGTAPHIARFSSGVAKSENNPGRYSSGAFAWHVMVADPATVTFDTNPSTVTFFVLSENLGTVSDIQVLDENDDLIMPVIIPTPMFVQVIISRDPGQTLIGSIIVTSTSGGDVVIDDFVWVIP